MNHTSTGFLECTACTWQYYFQQQSRFFVSLRNFKMTCDEILQQLIKQKHCKYKYNVTNNGDYVYYRIVGKLKLKNELSKARSLLSPGLHSLTACIVFVVVVDFAGQGSIGLDLQNICFSIRLSICTIIYYVYADLYKELFNLPTLCSIHC